ncbi:MAG: T9SS type A sorting domain-containing protein [Saprospiraceae bacterium]
MRKNSTKLKFLSLILFWGILISPVFSANRTIIATGNWGNAATWQGGQMPLTGDDVTMNNGTAVTVRFTDGLLSVEAFTAGNNNGLTINPFGSLTVTGLNAGNDFTVVVNGFLTIIGDFIVDDRLNLVVNGILSVTGNMSVMNDADIEVNGLMTVGSFNGLDRTSFDVNGIFGSVGDFFVGHDSSFDSDGASLFGGSLTAKDRFDLHVDGGMGITNDLNAGAGSTSTGSGTLRVFGTINGPAGFGPLAPLPISLLYFKGLATTDGVLLNWATESEESNEYFTIERSKDGIRFETLAKIKGAGNSFTPLEYDFLDTNPHKLTYYRLSQTDFDGTTEFFDIISVITNTVGEVKVYPTLVKEGLIKVVLPSLDDYNKVMITDLAGRLILQQTIGTGENTILLPGHLDNGMYLVRMLGEGGIVSTAQKIMVQK